MITDLDVSIRGRNAFLHLICAAIFCVMMSACGGGGGNSPGSGSSGGTGSGGGSGSGTGSRTPATTLSCAGYPKTFGFPQNYTQVCLLTQQSVAATPSLSVTTDVGNLLGHGRDNLSDFTLYTQIIAQAADEATATALAKSVVVSTANASISAASNPVTSPETLSINFEVFTASTTNLTLINNFGDQSADNYNATLNLKPQTGNVTLQTLQGNVTVNDQRGNVTLQTLQGEATVNDLMGNVILQTVQGSVTVNDQTGNVTLQTVQGEATVNDQTGNIAVTLSGSRWTGAGMNATTQMGNVSVSRPMGYQAAFTAKSDAGNASIDSQTATSEGSTGAVVTAGSGAPIMLESKEGNVSVTVSQ